MSSHTCLTKQTCDNHTSRIRHQPNGLTAKSYNSSRTSTCEDPLNYSLIVRYHTHTAIMTVLSTLLHATAFRSPFLSTLLPSIGLAYGIQGLVAIPSILAQSEKFYDLSGSLTYLSCTALSLYLPTIRARYAAQLAGTIKPAWPSLAGALMGKAGSGLNWRQVVLSAAVSVWATRCMSP